MILPKIWKMLKSDRSYENKKNIKKVEKTLRYELRIYDVRDMDKIAEDQEDAARRYNTEIFTGWLIN